MPKSEGAFNLSDSSVRAFSSGSISKSGVLDSEEGKGCDDMRGGRIGIAFSVGLMGGEPVLPRPSFERIGMLERDSRFLGGEVGSSDERRWGMDGLEFGIVDCFVNITSVWVHVPLESRGEGMILKVEAGCLGRIGCDL